MQLTRERWLETLRRGLLILLVILWPDWVAALPVGRAWAPSQLLRPSGFWYLAAPRLERDSLGVPVLYATAPMRSPTDGSSDAFGYRWADTSWAQAWQLGLPPLILSPVQSPPRTQHLVWTYVKQGFETRVALRLAQVLGDRVAAPETVAVIPDAFSYSAAVTDSARWVAAQLRSMPPESVVVYFRDNVNRWRPVMQTPLDYGDEGVAISVLDDTTALVAWADDFGDGVHWGTLQRDVWQAGAPAIPEVMANSPRFRRRPSGGQWLAWGATHPEIGMASFRDGRWSAPETLRCAYRDPVSQHWSQSPDLSRDDDEYEYPVVAWSSTSSSASVDANVCLCIPSDSGTYGVAEEVDIAINGGLVATIRDHNGDVWLAWWMSDYSSGVRWSHTYVVATAERPQVVAAGNLREVRWRLSGAAPGSWWMVERMARGGPWVEVARVRAGPDTLMRWVDGAAPAGLVSYRVRRPSVDRRYEWVSAEARWPEQQGVPQLLRVSANPGGASVQFEVADAIAGALEAVLYDLQGRAAWRGGFVSAGTGRDVLTIDVAGQGARLRSGIYFLRVKDAAGRMSAVSKVAVVR